jgi:hypothetical protein
MRDIDGAIALQYGYATMTIATDRSRSSRPRDVDETGEFE